MAQIVTKTDLMSWLNRLAEEKMLIAPKSVGEQILFQKIENSDDIVMDYNNTALSPKEWFFPPSEIIFQVDKKDGQTELIPSGIEQEAVIFGIRPCDAKGMAIIDKPFYAEPTDTLYKEKRDKTTLIGLACSSVCPECFCTSMGSAPNDSSDLDIMLTQVDDKYIVEAVTEKGKAILPSELIKEANIESPPPPEVPSVPAEDLVEIMARVFNDPFWSRLADRCLHCNTCAYVCPTCYCFDIRDYMHKGKIDRVRSWESCQSRGFTKIAGGHEPRTTKESRLRQRFYHKLFYFPEKFNEIACVGCGRCAKSCPVNIDIREIIEGVHKLGAKVES
jgi:ferredoxin